MPATGPLAVRPPPAPASAPLLQGLQGFAHPSVPRQALARRYFEQGLMLVYGFNPAEAARSLQACVAREPGFAPGWWALAWALGPNINTDMAPADEPLVLHALQQARRGAPQAPPVWQGLIAALSRRHPRPGAIDEEGYEQALQQLARRFANHAQVALLAAEALLNLHPYDWWAADGSALPHTPRIEALLQRCLRLQPRHPGAHHYWIHLQESSARPQRGVASAQALRGAYPGSGHLLHMPSHIDMRVGRYDDAIAANQRSIEADLQYLAQVDAQGAYRVGYVAHNHHFLWAAAGMAGRHALALQAAQAAWPAACGPGGRDPGLAITAHYAALPALTQLRFGRWRELLHGTPPPDAPGPYALALWHYARATAQLRLGEVEAARRSQQQLQQAARSTDLGAARVKNINPAADLLQIAQLTLQADLQAQSGQAADAVRSLQRATALEDALVYDEPHLWLAPTRHALADALLRAGQPAQAQACCEQDLRHYPANGWSLQGLAMALQAQGHTGQARLASQQARQAFAQAQHVPEGSRWR